MNEPILIPNVFRCRNCKWVFSIAHGPEMLALDSEIAKIKGEIPEGLCLRCTGTKIKGMLINTGKT